MKKNYYNINFNHLTVLLLPILLRKLLITKLIKCMIRPILALQRDFIHYIGQIDTSMSCTVCLMETLVNNYFDYYLKRITIQDSTDRNFDFQIVLPKGMTLTVQQTRQLHTIVDENKLTGMRYNIIHQQQ